MNGVWSFIKDGKPTGAKFIGPARALAANTPEGCTAVEGALNADRQDPEMQRARIMVEIQELEQKQLRSMADLMVDPSDQRARLHFDRRMKEISRLRASLSGTDASAPSG
jgi:hypothetical protein